MIPTSEIITLYINEEPKRFSDVFANDSYQIAHTDKDFAYYFVPKEGGKEVTDVEAIVEAIKGKYTQMKGGTT